MDTERTDAPAWADAPEWDDIVAAPGPESPPAAPAADPAPPAPVPTGQPTPGDAPPAAPPPTETPGTQASAPSAPPTPEPAPPPATPVAPEPFSIKLAGRVVPLDGATIANGMISIPEATFRRQMQAMLHDPQQTTQTIGRLRQELETATQRQTAQQAEAAYTLEQMHPILLGPDDAVAWEKVMALRATYKDNWHKARTQQLEQQLEARTRGDQDRGLEQRLGRWEQQVLPGWLDDYTGQVLVDPSYADLAQYQPFVADLKQAIHEDADRFLKATGTIHPEMDLPEFEGDPTEFARIVARVARPHRAYLKQIKALETKPVPSAPAAPPGGSVSQPATVAAPKVAGSARATDPKEKWRQELEEADLTAP